MAAKGNSCFRLANVKQIFSSETAWPNGAKLGRKHLCKIFYKTSSFGSIWPTNMAVVIKNNIDAFCKVWFHLAQLFLMSRLKYEKVNGWTRSDDNTSLDPLGQVS
jgi:hypothetical protein